MSLQPQPQSDKAAIYGVRSPASAAILLDLVRPALEHAGGYTEEHVLDALQAHEVQGWIIEKGNARGGLVTRVRTFPSGERDLFVWLMGGADFMLWSEDIIAALSRFAQEQSCRQLTAVTRPGLSRWLTRRLGWTKQAEIVEMQLDGFR